MEWFGLVRTFIDKLVQSSCHGQGYLSDQVSQSLIQLDFQGYSTHRDSLDGISQYLTTFIMKNFSLISNLNWSSFSFKPFHLVLSCHSKMPLSIFLISSHYVLKVSSFSPAFSSLCWTNPALSAFLCRRGVTTFWTFLQSSSGSIIMQHHRSQMWFCN